MKSFFQSAKGYILAHKIMSVIVVIILGTGTYYTFHKTVTGPTQYVLAAVTRDTVESSITGSGQISAESTVTVSPQGSGQVEAVNVTVGQKVVAGQTLAILDERDAETAIAQAKANLESEQANYDKTIGGLSTTTLAIDQGSLQSAQLSLTNAQENALSKISQTYTTLNNDIVNKTYPLFTYPLLSNPQLSISGVNFNNSTLVSEVNTELPLIEAMLSTWQTQIAAFNSTTDPTAATNDAIANLQQLDTFFGNLATLFNSYAIATNSSAQSSVTSDTINSGNINSDKTTMSGAENDAETGISNLQSSIQSLQSSQLSYTQAQANFASQTAAPDAATVDSAQAQLLSSQASLQSAENTYQNNIITAPISGTIATVGLQVGGQSASSAFTIITPQQLAVIPLNEVDVSKVAIGDKAILTLDALPDLTLTGKVAEIDPLGTVSQGVVTYSVQIALDTQNASVKSNMSVDVSIITGVDADVLVVPSSAVKTQGTTSYVQLATGIATSTPSSSQATGAVLLESAPVNTTVVTGLSNATEVEITSGLKEGDIVVERSIASTAAKTTTTAASGFNLLGGGTAGRAAGGGGFTGGAARTTGAAAAR